MPSESESWCSAAATPAAGPEPIVNDGAARKASRLIAPPSPRRTSSGTSIPASRRTPSTTRAVRSTTGRIDAFTAAETVRVSRPYVPVSSWPAQTGSPRSRARAATIRSCSGVSTENAPLTASAAQPAASRRSSAASIRAGSRPRVASRKACSVCRTRPGASLRSPTCVRLRARRSSGSTPMPITPTRATSPSRSAFIACVVEYATSSTRPRSSPRSSSSARSTAATPSVTPAAAVWLVGTTACARSVSGCRVSATALVNVPPTSTPTRMPPPMAYAVAVSATRRRRRAGCHANT